MLPLSFATRSRFPEPSPLRNKNSADLGQLPSGAARRACPHRNDASYFGAGVATGLPTALAAGLSTGLSALSRGTKVERRPLMI